MVQSIQQEGLTVPRFQEIYEAQQGASGQSAKPVSEDDKQKFARAVNKIAGIQEQNQPRMRKAVQDQGLAVERFQQILAAVRQSPDLQQQVQKLIKS
jgi:CHASE3 domain sensor protein